MAKYANQYKRWTQLLNLDATSDLYIGHCCHQTCGRHYLNSIFSEKATLIIVNKYLLPFHILEKSILRENTKTPQYNMIISCYSFFLLILCPKGAQWKMAWIETEGSQVQASPASLLCGPWARHIFPSLVLFQPRKTRPCLTERLCLLPSTDLRWIVVSYKRKYVHEVLVNCLVKLAQEKCVIMWTDRPDMTIAVEWDVKH